MRYSTIRPDAWERMAGTPSRRAEAAASVLSASPHALDFGRGRDHGKDKTETRPCKYYAYFEYGPAMLLGQFPVKENAFRVSKIRRFLRGFRAAYTVYDQTRTAGVTLINVGPYDTELVTYLDLQDKIARFEAQGYKPYDTRRHLFPAVLLRYAVEC